jgi:hypothetical protein
VSVVAQSDPRKLRRRWYLDDPGLQLKGEEMATIATTLEEIVVSAVPTLAITLEGGAKVVVSPMSLNLKGEEMSTHATSLEGGEMVVFPMTLKFLNLPVKGEEMPAHATTLEGSDSNAAACPTTTNSSLKPRNRRMRGRIARRHRPVRQSRLLRHGWHILCYDHLIAACLMYLLHYYQSSEDEVENGSGRVR